MGLVLQSRLGADLSDLVLAKSCTKKRLRQSENQHGASWRTGDANPKLILRLAAHTLTARNGFELEGRCMNRVSTTIQFKSHRHGNPRRAITLQTP
jgi:hypothetical protein